MKLKLLTLALQVTAVFDRDANVKKSIRLTKFRGSPHYVAPQLVRRQCFDGKKADVWSLGVLCYTLLFARFPFAGNSPREVFRSISYGTPEFSSDVLDDTKDFILSMLSRNELMRPELSSLLAHPWLENCQPLPPVVSLLYI